MIIETSDNRFYRVYPTGDANLEHCWNGMRVKRVRSDVLPDGTQCYAYLAMGKRLELVRKAATRVVEA